jgi:diguanylate cyclase (GGDEF)-like protein
MQHQCEHKNDQIYLHHKDGHRVPVAVSVSLIRDENGMSVGAAEVFSEIAGIDDEALMIEALKRESLIDMLTSLPNRRYLQTHLAGSMLEFERHGIGFGVIFADVDHFKAFNDTYGHAVGDDVLRLVGTTLGGCMRAYDMVGRWGGEEFLAVVHFADEYQLRLVAEKLRMLVEQSFLSHAGERLQVTMTFGVTRVKPGDTVEALLGRADRLLYEGKAAGRNRAQFG